MKKMNLIPGYWICAVVLLIIFSCSKEKDDNNINDNCNKLAEDYSNAVIAFTTDMTNEQKCKDFVSAAEDYIKNCGLLSASQKEEFQKQVDEANCSN